MNILNAKITKVVWERERVLTQYIYVEGNGWGSCFGGYDLRGEACSRWLENLMETLGITSFSDQNLVGLNVRVGFGGDGGIGSPIVGGETLVFPLIILLIYFGYSMGREISAQKAFEAGYNKGRSIAGGGGDDE